MREIYLGLGTKNFYYALPALEEAGIGKISRLPISIRIVLESVLLNCAAGIPLLGDLTAIRGAVTRMGYEPGMVEPRVPVDMALDHTLTVDYHGTPDALSR